MGLREANAVACTWWRVLRIKSQRSHKRRVLLRRDSEEVTSNRTPVGVLGIRGTKGDKVGDLVPVSPLLVIASLLDSHGTASCRKVIIKSCLTISFHFMDSGFPVGSD